MVVTLKVILCSSFVVPSRLRLRRIERTSPRDPQGNAAVTPADFSHSLSPLGLLKDTRCQCKDQPFVQLLPSLGLIQLLTFASLRAGQAASRGQPHTFRQELELSDYRRGLVRPFRALREHQANTHRERAQDKGNRVRSIRRRHGCTFPFLYLPHAPTPMYVID